MPVDLLVQDREVRPEGDRIERGRVHSSGVASTSGCTSVVIVVIVVLVGLVGRYRPAPAGSGSRGSARASSGTSIASPFSRRIGP